MSEIGGFKIGNPAFLELLQVATGETGKCRRLHGLEGIISTVLLCYFAGYRDDLQVDHVLLCGINGLAKTELVKNVAIALNGEALTAFFDLVGQDAFTRTTGSPDQTPADYRGGDVPGPRRTLKWQDGPLSEERLVKMADEINRTQPKTQAAMLEPMAERAISANSQDPDRKHNRTIRLFDFWLVAAMNPLHHIGTHPLPEAQLDRFMVLLVVPYTSELAKLLRPEDPAVCGSELEKKIEQKLNERKDVSTRNRERLLDAVSGFDTTVPRYQRLLGTVWNRLEAMLKEPPPGSGIDEFASLPDNARDWAEDCFQLSRTVEELSAKARRQRLTRDERKRVKEAARRIDSYRGALLRVRHQYLRRLELEVAFGTLYPQASANHAARLTYWTWSEEASRACGCGIEGLVSRHPPVVRAVKGQRQGASPRAAIALQHLACAVAWAEAPDTSREIQVTCEHIDRIAGPVLRHRVIVSNEAAARGATADSIVRAVVETVRAEGLAGAALPAPPPAPLAAPTTVGALS